MAVIKGFQLLWTRPLATFIGNKRKMQLESKEDPKLFNSLPNSCMCLATWYLSDSQRGFAIDECFNVLGAVKPRRPVREHPYQRWRWVEREPCDRAIFVWPWNEITQRKQKQQINGNRVIWWVCWMDTNGHGFWLVIKVNVPLKKLHARRTF